MGAHSQTHRFVLPLFLVGFTFLRTIPTFGNHWSKQLHGLLQARGYLIDEFRDKSDNSTDVTKTRDFCGNTASYHSRFHERREQVDHEARLCNVKSDVGGDRQEFGITA